MKKWFINIGDKSISDYIMNEGFLFIGSFRRDSMCKFCNKYGYELIHG